MLFNYSNVPNIEGDAWYYPQRHDLFLYDSSGLIPIGFNPDFYKYIPDSSNPNYSFNYNMPSFSCLHSQSRRTNNIPNGGTDYCCENNCDFPPYSGCPSRGRYIAITPAHVLAINHYYAPSSIINYEHKFFSSTSGDNFQKTIVRDRFPIGIVAEDAPSDAPSGEIVLLEIQAAAQNIDPDQNAGEEYLFNTVLGDPTVAPDINIKYPYFMPQLGFGDDPLKEYMINNLKGFVFDQDIRCHFVGIACWNTGQSLYNHTASFVAVRQTNGTTNLDYLVEKNLGILEDAGGTNAIPGDSSSTHFTHIPSVSSDSPVLLGQLSGGSALINQLKDYIVPVIQDYDNANGTSYANDVLNRIIKRSQIGVDDWDLTAGTREKESFVVIDLKPIWEDKTLPTELNSIMVLGEMINEKSGFLLDSYFDRIINFNLNDQDELSWSEATWEHDDAFNISGIGHHRHITTFNNEIYLCGATGYGDTTFSHWPDMYPGIISKFIINSDNKVEYVGNLFDINDNPIEYFGYAIASNSKDLFISGGVSWHTGTEFDYAPWDPLYGYPNPKVIVYSYEDDQWKKKQTLQPDGYSPSDEVYYTERFGSTIACSDEWLFIANDPWDVEGANYAIYTYKRDESGEWKQIQIIEAPSNSGNYFAREMIIDNNTLIVSCEKYQKNEFAQPLGATFIYKIYEPNDQWLLSNIIEFDYKLEEYDFNSQQGIWNYDNPDFSKSMSGNSNFLMISAPYSINSYEYSIPSNHQYYIENRPTQYAEKSGIATMYRFNENEEEWNNQFLFDNQSFIGYSFGSWVSTYFTYDEYVRIKSVIMISLENILGLSSNTSKENFSGGKIIIKNQSYNTFPINKNFSNLKGLGQSFNTKLIPAYTKTIPFINTSSSPNGIVALPLDIHPAYSAVFEKYTKLVAPGKKAIHVLIQERVDETEVVYLRDVLSKILTNKDGSLYGSNKTDVFNGMANNELIIGMFNNSEAEESSDSQFLSGEFNINIKIINQDDIDINEFLNTNKTVGVLTESTYTYGIYYENPSMKSALNAARIQAEGVEGLTPNLDFQFYSGLGTNTPESFSNSQEVTERKGIFYPKVTGQEEKNIRYLRLGVEVFYGMWDHDPNATGWSGEDEYSIISKDQLQSIDPGLYDIINGFFPNDITTY